MTYKLKRLLLILLLGLLVIISVYIIGYFLFAKDVFEKETFTISFLAVIMLYIFGQIVKRFLQPESPWYSWLYYVGLVVIVLPAFLDLGDSIAIITRIGSFFLLFPPLLELISVLKSNQTNS